MVAWFCLGRVAGDGSLQAGLGWWWPLIEKALLLVVSLQWLREYLNERARYEGDSRDEKPKKRVSDSFFLHLYFFSFMFLEKVKKGK